MSYFYGYLAGSRGTATRCGGKNTGIHSHIRSFTNDVYADLTDRDNKDLLKLTIPEGLQTSINGIEIKITKTGIKIIKSK